MKKTNLPYRGPRKARAHERTRYEVRWVESGLIHFQLFKRYGAAAKLHLSLQNKGHDVIITEL